VRRICRRERGRDTSTRCACPADEPRSSRSTKRLLTNAATARAATTSGSSSSRRDVHASTCSPTARSCASTSSSSSTGETPNLIRQPSVQRRALARRAPSGP